VLDASSRGFVPSLRRANKTLMQLPSMTGLKTRWRERVDRAARGTDVPAGIERGADAASTAGSRERGQMRRRLRELRRLREAQLLELGALVLEAHRHERDDSPVVKHKAAEAAAVDAEARALAEALETDAGLGTVVATGIAGPCPTCGTLASTAARFCSTCGTALDGRPDAAPRAEAAAPDPVETDPADVSTELPVPNGNGASPDEIEATTGREA
jgi:hypothetical protein